MAHLRVEINIIYAAIILGLCFLRIKYVIWFINDAMFTPFFLFSSLQQSVLFNRFLKYHSYKPGTYVMKAEWKAPLCLFYALLPV